MYSNYLHCIIHCTCSYLQRITHALRMHMNMHYTPSTTNHTVFHNPHVHTTITKWRHNGTKCRDDVKGELPCAQNWNKLPANLRNAQSVKTFTKLLNTQYFFVPECINSFCYFPFVILYFYTTISCMVSFLPLLFVVVCIYRTPWQISHWLKGHFLFEIKINQSINQSINQKNKK